MCTTYYMNEYYMYEYHEYEDYVYESQVYEMTMYESDDVDSEGFRDGLFARFEYLRQSLHTASVLSALPQFVARQWFGSPEAIGPAMDDSLLCTMAPGWTAFILCMMASCSMEASTDSVLLLQTRGTDYSFALSLRARGGRGGELLE
ncbi:hypothetical protein FOZ60_011594 [Perkinsus olseni]|uniref:Uncharacterized protein n=1 Tax=Perkinsus olseni TaxID=32597 RepID=A0A7J6NCZ8_PEROL|nr:hypothetical protein FOZ60_011594 [Perkinsus olseni]